MPSSRPCSRFRPCLEALEDRTLLSGNPLDPTFGAGGKVITSFPGQDSAAAVALQSGKVLVVGSYNLVRYTSAGMLDSGFGNQGIVHNPTFTARALAVQSGDKIIVVGYGASANLDFVVARYNANGTPDGTFGNGGVVTTSFGSIATAAAVVVQTDGKVLVAGADGGDVALARYNTNGSLDDGGVYDITPGDSFGNGGKEIADVNFTVTSSQALALQSDGQILVAGRISNGGINDFALARLTSTGVLDAGFGNGGVVSTDFSTYHDEAHGVVQLPGGKIVVCGTANAGGVNSSIALAQYNTNGSLDDGGVNDSTPGDSFGTLGKVITSASVNPVFTNSLFGLGLVRAPDGKLVVVGTADVGTVQQVAHDFVVARYNPDGSLDPTFGDGGTTATDFGSPSDEGAAIVVQPDSKPVVAGTTSVPNTFISFAVARYKAVTTGNNPPIASAGGPYTLTLGESLALSAAGSSDPDGDPLAYAWDVNGDNNFADASGPNPTLSAAQLTALGISAAGTRTVTVRVDDGQGEMVTASATLTVLPAPVAPPSTGPALQTLIVRLTKRKGIPFLVVLNTAIGASYDIKLPRSWLLAGVQFAVGEVNGDNVEDIVATIRKKTGPVKVFNGPNGVLLGTISGGVLGKGKPTLELSDTRGDSRKEIIISVRNKAKVARLTFDGISQQLLERI
jgi:uncharacterized delta-60 repeat protein